MPDLSRSRECCNGSRCNHLRRELANVKSSDTRAFSRETAACRSPSPARPNVLSLSRHVPSRPRGATQRVAPAEPRKRRADERHVVGCCEELARAGRRDQPDESSGSKVDINELKLPK